MNSSSPRYTKLDGLRGLLSLTVALNHSFLVVAIPGFANVWGQNYLEFHDLQSKIQQLLMILGNGGVAVTAFFVLSGLVLGQSLSRTHISGRGLLAFYLKRVIRLYPVYLFVLCLTAIYMRFFFVHQLFPPASSWFHWWMNFAMTAQEFIYNFFFIHAYVGGVTWTLRVILIASFLFPSFYLLTRKTSWWVDHILTVLLIYASFTVLNLPGFRDLRYLYMFFLGLTLPKFGTFFSRVASPLIWLATPLLLILLFVIRYATDEYLGGVVEAFISWLIIGLIVYQPQTKFFDLLNHPKLLYFGKISYSLYLIHFSVLYIIARAMFMFFPDLPYATQYLGIHTGLFLLSLAVATLISHLVYRLLELPSLTVSRLVGDRLSS